MKFFKQLALVAATVSVSSAAIIDLVEAVENAVNGIENLATEVVDVIEDLANSTTTTYSNDSIVIPSSIIKQAKYDEVTYEDTCLYTSEELYEHALLFLHTFIYPNNVPQAESINSTLFTDDVAGRIEITRDFIGRELNTEYLFGLFVQLAGDSNITNIFGYGIAYEMNEFIGRCNQYTFTAVINASFPLFKNEIIPFEVNIYVRLDEEKKISQYDLKFPKWQRFYGIVQTLGVKALTNETTLTSENLPYLQAALAKSICEIHELYCLPNYRQYSSFDECYNYLTKDVRFGESWEGGRDTLFCRSLHQNMLRYRPSVHCPHIGYANATGNDMCTNEGTTYLDTLFNYKSTFEYPWIAI